MGGIQARAAAGECVVTRAHCPVGELAGDPHTYVAGDGVVIPWDVAGDPRTGVEACRGCVSVIDQDYDNARRCESCGVTGGGVEGGLCEECFANMPMDRFVLAEKIR